MKFINNQKSLFLKLSICMVLNVNCIIGVIKTDREELGYIPKINKPTEVVILIKGKYCHGTEGLQGDYEKYKCRKDKLSEEDFFPVDVLSKNLGREFQEKFSTTGSTAMDVLRDKSNQKSFLDSFVADIKERMNPTLNNSPADQNGYNRKTFTDHYAWTEYKNSSKKNTLLIYYDAKEEEGIPWSILLSFATLGIVPGVMTDTYQINANYFDNKGKSTEFTSKSAIRMDKWNHILFIWWSQIQYPLAHNKLIRIGTEEMAEQVPLQ